MNSEGISTSEVIALLLAVVIVIVFLAVLLEFTPECSTMASQTPRPTLPSSTPTYEVFLPIGIQSEQTKSPTPRPTLGGK